MTRNQASEGWLTVHTIGQRGSCGGIRLYPDVTKEETVVLAKAMTYKYCMSGYSLGGAKGAVRMPFDIDDAERRMLLESFGRHIGPLIKSKIYQPWTDMNCSVDDLRSIYKGAGKTAQIHTCGFRVFHRPVNLFGLVGCCRAPRH